MKKLLSIVTVLWFPMMLLLNSCSTEGEFKIGIESQTKLIVSDSLVWDDGKVTYTKEFKDVFVVEVVKDYNTNSMFDGFYMESSYTQHKDEIPNLVCKMKRKILEEHEKDVLIEEEIEKIKDELNNIDCKDGRVN